MSLSIAAVEELEAEIAELSDGVKRLLAGDLTQHALVTLIYEAMQPSYRNKAQIKEVLRAVSNLKTLYTKRPKIKEASDDKR